MRSFDQEEKTGYPDYSRGRCCRIPLRGDI